MLPGGPAAKLGSRYETWCVVAELMRLLYDDADALRIEVPGIDKAEFVVEKGTRCEAHQVKRSHPNGKWSFAALRTDGLIRYIGEYLADNQNRFVFTSGSEARELLELVEAAREADSTEEFARSFLGETKRRRRFATLQADWECDAPTAIDRLRRIYLRTVDERELRERVRWTARALFVVDPERVLTELRALVEDSLHCTIVRQELVAGLSRRGYPVRRVSNPQAAALVVEEATTRYVDGARRRLIRNALVPRSASATLLSRLDAAPSDSVITGKAGGGKTACVVEVTEGLRTRGQPVLAFRLDRIPPSVHTATDLGRHLGLEESPVLVLAAAVEAAKRPGVLIVDQLDAVSTMSGRSSVVFDLVERLVEEARGTRARATIHTIVVCRSFDWKNDPRLRRLLPKDHDQIEVTEFRKDEVETVLRGARFDPALFKDRQLELLRLPQNLSLFLEADFDPSLAPAFQTATKLFDEYWETKRTTLAEVVAADHWISAMEAICTEIDATQLLSVPRERLDRIPHTYLRQLASEGVLTYDGRRYGFGHESFFDYCFARTFMNRPESITTVLKSSEQHLFRRAQVRQVLAYLRDADPQRYVRELADLLSDQHIRPHIKELALALLADVTDPTTEEWTIWQQRTASAFQGIESGVPCPDKLSVLAWRCVFGSASWFSEADRRGLIEGWLASANDRVVDMAMNCLWIHHSHAPDRVAMLLDPYADRGGKWVNRLRSLMERTQHHTSRRYFDLLLRLVDNGTVDENTEPNADPEFLSHMLFSVGENRPEWVPEAVARYLRRRLSIIHTSGKELDASALIGYGETAEKMIQTASERAPVEFVTHLLPVVLSISSSHLIGDVLPKRDAVWAYLPQSEPHTGEQACLFGLSSALMCLTERDSGAFQDTVSDLRRSSTYVSNFLLQSVYRAAPEYFANEAVLLLCRQPWRFDCGVSESPNSTTMLLIKAVIRRCSISNRQKLESVILNYVAPYERPTAELRRKGFKYNRIGRTSYSLLSEIPTAMLSTRANRYFHELQRRFGNLEDRPYATSGGFVRSPIAEAAAAKMTDDEWLLAIAKYTKGKPPFSWPDYLKGGASELSQVLEKQTREDPHRFARLSLRFPVDANPVYLERVLDAVRETSVETQLKLAVCRKAYTDARTECGKSIADVLGSIEDARPEDAITMLRWLATEHEDPKTDAWQEDAGSGQTYYGGDIYTNGINTTRGRAASAIQRLVQTDTKYIERFRPALDRMINDQSAAVLSCVASALAAVVYHDSSLGMSLFLSMNLSEDRLLTTPHVDWLIRRHLHDEFPGALRVIIERMLHSTDEKVCQAGGRLASIAAMIHQNAADIGDRALRGDPSQRSGVAEVAAGNVGVSWVRAWCEERLLMLFNDDDHDVRQKASFCFDRIPDDSIESYTDLVEAFCDSRAFAAGARSLIRALEKSRGRLPGMTCMVCERVLDRPSRNTFAVAKLIFRTYQQHQNDEWASRTLDLIDRLCLDGYPGIGSELDDFDR